MPVFVVNAEFDPWYLENLVCPIDRKALHLDGNYLISQSGRNYPIVEGMPVLLIEEARPTIGVQRKSLEVASAIAAGKGGAIKPPYVETLGISDEEKALVRRLHDGADGKDAVVNAIVGATCGHAYKHLIGSTEAGSYPIPELRLPNAASGTLLDVGCNWGRWTIAAARQGLDAIGVDPQLEAILAARRIAARLGVAAHFVVADGRFLPFKDGAFDYVWSYSVLQHFAKDDARIALCEIRRVARPKATVRIQMANLLGARSFYNSARRGFRKPIGFEVRYWTPAELQRTFGEIFGEVQFSADCFLGLGLQWSDFRWVSPLGKLVLLVSESVRRLSEYIPPLKWLADSLFCTAVVQDGSRGEAL